MLCWFLVIRVFVLDYVNRNSSVRRLSNDNMVNIISIVGDDDIENRVNIVSSYNIF